MPPRTPLRRKEKRIVLGGVACLSSGVGPILPCHISHRQPTPQTAQQRAGMIQITVSLLGQCDSILNVPVTPNARNEAWMRIAILTDIHANREALQAVLDDAAACSVDRHAVLGDIVGYGPDPAWCLKKVADLVANGAICVQGNHDEAAVKGPDASFNSNARTAILWTAEHLNVAQKAFLATLPLRHSENGVLYVHASAHSSADWIYVSSARKAMPSFRACTERLIVCGHVHVPALMHCDRGGQVRQIAFPMGKPVPLLRTRRWLAVIGSVGQPRDGSPLASYAILDQITHELTFRRVPYDTAATVQKLRAAGLPEALALRLIRGN